MDTKWGAEHMKAIKNYMEYLVEMNLDHIAEGLGCCLCEKCRADITALALNHLPSKYVVSDEGEVFTKMSALQQQAEIDVTSAIMQAALTVSKNPRHTE